MHTHLTLMIIFYGYCFRRESAIKELFGRQVTLQTDEHYLTKELFVLDELKVPTAWVHEAKVF